MLDDGIMNGAGKPGYGMSEERDRIQEGRDARRTRSRFQSDWTSACVQDFFFLIHGMVWCTHVSYCQGSVTHTEIQSCAITRLINFFFLFPSS